jgi:DHA2 family multidrug resistance protein-like MFS transporter
MTAGDVPKAGRREWLGLAVLALPTFLVAIDIFVLMLALPKLTKELGASSTQQLWISDIYGFTLAGFTVTMGTLGDRIGRRKVLLTGSAAFGVISVLTAYSTSPGMLIVLRGLLGISGAMLMPQVLALIFTLFADEKQRARAFGLWGGVFTLGAIFGPVVGGILLDHFWWGSVFMISAPLMVIMLIAAPILLPEVRNPNAGKLDPTSVVLSLATMLPIIWGIKQLARNGWELLPILAIIVGGIAGIAFGRRQGKLADPVLDLRLFRNRNISTALISQLAYSTTGGGFMLLAMLYFQLVKGMSTLHAAFAMAPGLLSATLGFMVVTPYLASKFRPAYVIGVGMAGVAAVMLYFTTIGATTGAPALIIGFAILSICGSPLIALGTNMIVGSAPPEQMGSAGSMAQMSNEFGGTLGPALFGTLGFAIYRSDVHDHIPAGLSAHDAASARDSLAGATLAAAHAPHQTADALLGPARQAYANGLHAVCAIGGTLLGLIAIFIATRLRHMPPIGKQSTEADGQAEAAPVAEHVG